MNCPNYKPKKTEHVCFFGNIANSDSPPSALMTLQTHRWHSYRRCYIIYVTNHRHFKDYAFKRCVRLISIEQIVREQCPSGDKSSVPFHMKEFSVFSLDLGNLPPSFPPKQTQKRPRKHSELCCNILCLIQESQQKQHGKTHRRTNTLFILMFA